MREVLWGRFYSQNKEWEKSNIVSLVLKETRGTEKLIDFVDESAGKISRASVLMARASFFHLNLRCPLVDWRRPAALAVVCVYKRTSSDLAGQTDKEMYDLVVHPKETPAWFQKSRKEKYYWDATWSFSTALF